MKNKKSVNLYGTYFDFQHELEARKLSKKRGKDFIVLRIPNGFLVVHKIFFQQENGKK